MVNQQQHSSNVQLGHWKEERLDWHSSGEQLQSAHFIKSNISFLW